MSRLFTGFIAMLAVAGSLTPVADAAGLRVRGEIKAVSGDLVTVESADGSAVEVALAEPVVLLYRDIALDDVGEGAYVAVPSIAADDGRRQALGLVVFPEKMRGMNEGFKPWDLTAESKMTNATVAEVVGRSGERVLTVTYGEDEQTIVVPEDVQISTFAPAPEMTIELGQKVVIFADDASGQVSGTFVGIHENGGLPPL